MSDQLSFQSISPQTSQLVWVIAQVALLWTVSDVGYYFLLPALDVEPNYNNGSLEVAIYYAFWIGIAVITFWPIYSKWSIYGRWSTFHNRLTSYVIWSLAFVGCLLFAAYILPQLPSVHWQESWTPPPEFVVATPAYFLPKSMDILFQQLLIVVLVLALAEMGYNLLKISMWCAIGFGAGHLLLVFGDVPIAYVIRFMLSAAVFGLMFPYLILRVPNGLAYSYIVHWLYYAVSAVLPHIFLASAK